MYEHPLYQCLMSWPRPRHGPKQLIAVIDWSGVDAHISVTPS